jgi:hypothetical protein
MLLFQSQSAVTVHVSGSVFVSVVKQQLSVQYNFTDSGGGSPESSLSDSAQTAGGRSKMLLESNLQE